LAKGDNEIGDRIGRARAGCRWEGTTELEDTGDMRHSRKPETTKHITSIHDTKRKSGPLTIQETMLVSERPVKRLGIVP